MTKISVLIPAFNSEKTIGPALESVKWAGEILVCDSYSTDRTLEIAKQYGARIIQHEYINSALQKNWAIPQCSYQWVLIVDTDEVVDPQLKEEILDVLKTPDADVDGYWIPRKNFIYGKWMRCGGIYPDYQLRFFRRDKGIYETREVHAHLKVPGRSEKMKGHLLHDGFKDLKTWMIKTERYIRYETDEMIKQNKKAGMRRIVFYPAGVFMKSYFLQKGFMEGYPGFLLAVLTAFYYFLMYARLHERQRQIG